MDEQGLLKLKREIDNAKTKVAELNGQLSQLMKQMKENFDCTDLKAADKKIKALEKEATELQERINTETAELEELYG